MSHQAVGRQAVVSEEGSVIRKEAAMKHKVVYFPVQWEKCEPYVREEDPPHEWFMFAHCPFRKQGFPATCQPTEESLEALEHPGYDEAITIQKIKVSGYHTEYGKDSPIVFVNKEDVISVECVYREDILIEEVPAEYSPKQRNTKAIENFAWDFFLMPKKRNRLRKRAMRKVTYDMAFTITTWTSIDLTLEERFGQVSKEEGWYWRVLPIPPILGGGWAPIAYSETNYLLELDPYLRDDFTEEKIKQVFRYLNPYFSEPQIEWLRAVSQEIVLLVEQLSVFYPDLLSPRRLAEIERVFKAKGLWRKTSKQKENANDANKH